MRGKLIKILREAESVSEFENEYHDAIGDELFDYLVDERVAFPNYRTLDSLYQRKYLPPTKRMQIAAPSSLIQAELKRMEADGLVLLGTQQGVKYAHTSDNGPDYDEGTRFTTESIVLTTKGRSGLQYLLYQATENPFNVAAIVISIVSLIISILKPTLL